MLLPSKQRTRWLIWDFPVTGLQCGLRMLKPAFPFEAVLGELLRAGPLHLFGVTKDLCYPFLAYGAMLPTECVSPKFIYGNLTSKVMVFGGGAFVERGLGQESEAPMNE